MPIPYPSLSLDSSPPLSFGKELIAPLILLDDEAPLVLLESGTEEETLLIVNDAAGEEISWTQKTITAAVSHSVLGHEGETTSFFTSTDAHLLVSSKGYYEDTVLSMAAAERYPRMVNLFLDLSAQINSRNDEGRTPLMEAALQGRAGKVMILLARGADQEMKDREGYEAIEFTARSEQDTEERHCRAGGIYREDTFNAYKQRKAIQRMLGRQNLTSTASFNLSKSRTPSYDYHYFHRSSITSEVVLSVPVARFPLPRLTKTIARLECGRPFSSVDECLETGYSQ